MRQMILYRDSEPVHTNIFDIIDGTLYQDFQGSQNQLFLQIMTIIFFATRFQKPFELLQTDNLSEYQW